MRIGIVLPNTPGYSETFFISKISGLAKAGFSVTIFARKANHWQNIIQEGVQIKEPNSISKFLPLQVVKMVIVILSLYFFHTRAVFRFIKLEKADGLSWRRTFEELYINAHILPCKLQWLHFGFASMGLSRENVAAAMLIKSALSFRGYDIAIYPLKHPHCYHRLFERIDKVHTISENLYTLALSHGLPTKKTCVKITPAINTGLFSCRNNKIMHRNMLKIITVGRLEWIKGYEYALETMLILKKRKIAFNYIITGEGNDWERLIFAAHQLGINNHIIFTGKKTPEEVAFLMDNADIYIQPSVNEGFCNAVLEAQAAGLITIVTDAGALPENVVNGKTGFVVPKRDAKAMADVICTVAKMTRDEIEKITAFAAKRVETSFNIDNQISQFVKFYAND